MQLQGEPFGHHAIVWEGGKTAARALIVSSSSDLMIAKHLDLTGRQGGNNLDPKTWDNRFDLNDPAADERVEGPKVEVWVEWNGSGGYRRLAELMGLPDADYRFGDHRQWIPVWHSGCIVCNVSCPGGKISNHTLTIRDQAQGRLKPHLRMEQLPPDGTPVRIKITRRKE
jgi:hypothetical protein